ncbi:hypothetical protein A2U01_0106098, partial [Trifolium medium]|nr:hypothetical protein [Trifolium medium]
NSDEIDRLSHGPGDGGTHDCKPLLSPPDRTPGIAALRIGIGSYSKVVMVNRTEMEASWYQ